MENESFDIGKIKYRDTEKIYENTEKIYKNMDKISALKKYGVI